MNKSLRAAAIAAALIALGATSCAAPASPAAGPSAPSSSAAPQSGTPGAPAPAATGAPAPAATDTPRAGSFTGYSAEAVSSASETEKVVLFFHAAWCSTCKLLARDIEANAASIPAGVKILKVDYDSETALKQKYGVTFQHTLVQVRPDGSQIAKWSLSRNLDALVKEIR